MARTHDSRPTRSPHSRRPLMSVRSRIVLAIIVITGLGLAGAGIASFLIQRQQALANVDHELSQVVPELKAIGDGKTSALPPRSVDEFLRSAMTRIVPDADESVLGLVGGEPAYIPAVDLPFRIDSDKHLVNRLSAEADPGHLVRGTAKSELGTLRYLIVPVHVTGDSTAGLYVAAYNLDKVLGAVSASFLTYLAVAALALILVGVAAAWVSGRLLAPIRRLREAAAANSAADLSERIEVTGNDDLSELTETINGMFDRLEASFVSQGRLLDDVGHELKTPITIIRGHLEILDPADPREVAETRALAIDELDRMSVLVSDISLLAESGAPHFVQPGDTDISWLTDAVAAKARAFDPGRQWVADAAARGRVCLDARRITQAWLQLAANAAKYSEAGAPIVLSSEFIRSRTGRWLHLSVRDAGPGIPVEEQERIFGRFTRLDSTRGAEGSGLGLAIVSAIAEVHGGSVLLDSAAGEASTFTIRIPAPDSEER